MSGPAVTMACLRLTCGSRRRNGVHVWVRCTRLGSRTRQAGHPGRGGATALSHGRSVLACADCTISAR